jgi:hypothetical protein
MEIVSPRCFETKNGSSVFHSPARAFSVTHYDACPWNHCGPGKGREIISKIKSYGRLCLKGTCPKK